MSKTDVENRNTIVIFGDLEDSDSLKMDDALQSEIKEKDENGSKKTFLNEHPDIFLKQLITVGTVYIIAVSAMAVGLVLLVALQNGITID